jgi:hypothetical protein
MINPELKVGDKVVLLTMEGEPDMSYGEKGIVERISFVFGHKQYRVKWENDRSLDLLEDADKWMYDEDFDKMKKKKKINEGYTITKKYLVETFVSPKK